MSRAMNELLEAIEMLDVNKINDAIKKAEEANRRTTNACRFQAELSEAKNAITQASIEIGKARKALTAAAGRIAVQDWADRPREASVQR